MTRARLRTTCAAARALSAALVFVSIAACTGNVGPTSAEESDQSPSTGGGGMPVVGMLPKPSAACQGKDTFVGGSTVKRLTRAQYQNTISDLFGGPQTMPVALPADNQVAGFDANVGDAGQSVLLAQNVHSVAEAVAAQAASNVEKLLGCRPGLTVQDTCVRAFIDQFGLRVYRRPLAVAEVDRLAKFYASEAATHNAQTGVSALLSVFLQSAQFLYRIEGLDASPGAGQARALNGFETASRLSFLLWNTMPDAELFKAAQAGGLSTAKQIADQADRMTKDPRARQGIGAFFTQWLHLGDLTLATKDPQTYPTWSTDVARWLETETSTFIAEEVLGKRSVASLLTAPRSYVNEGLAKFYGISGPKGEAFVPVNLDPKQRAGIVTQGSFMAGAAHPRSTSPVARGVLILDRVLCLPPPPPPPNVVTELPPGQDKASMRETLAQHRSNPACASCHAAIDSIGLAFENYDATGRWRTSEAAGPIDAKTTLSGLDDLDGTYDSPIDLLQRIANSPQTTQCLARQALRFAFARPETAADDCTVDALAQSIATEQPLLNLFTTLTQTAPFLAQGGPEVNR